jgi:uncharacterized protein
MNPVTEALLRPEAYPHPVETEGGVQVVETHISWIFLTGRFAYKLKKPIDLGFLDFSTLARRHHCCLEELRLNRRLCPDLYLDVLPVNSSNGAYRIGASGPVVDYVVQMVQFDRRFELDRLLMADRLTIEMVGSIAAIVAGFHRTTPAADQATAFGSPEVLLMPMLENLERTGQLIHSPAEVTALSALREWTLEEHRRLEPTLRQRKMSGFVRECHGDMHTGNMVMRDTRIEIFDCIEFNPRLSIIDVMSDAAFLFMDLQHSGRRHLAWHFLNAYLVGTGDYAGLRVLRLYCTYRAMVRAKVTAIRLSQEIDAERQKVILEEHRSYLSLALEFVRPSKPVLVLMRGFSGSGKSVLASKLADAGGFAHLRSDIERKRLFGISPTGSSSASGHDIYTAQASEETFRRLLDAAESAISGGYKVIVDATFLKRERRRPFIELADRMNCLCRIVCLSAPVETLRERVQGRLEDGGDPSEAGLSVLMSQMGSDEPPEEDEKSLCIDIDTGGPVDHLALAETLTS